MRLRALVASVLAALGLALASTAAAAPKAPDRPFTVATYNIHHAEGVDGRLDLERVADVIRASGAEVVALQEVDRHWSARSGFVDQASWLAGRLRMHVVYGANLDLPPSEPGRPRRQYGTAILSEYPIHASRNTLLPRPQGGEQRGLLEARLNVRGVRVRVANTHLQHDSQVERLAQVARILEILSPSTEPVVLAGDLNARPDWPEIAPLSALFRDAWRVAGEGPGFTYPATAPDRRIDYVFVSRDLKVSAATVIASPASDHLPVVAQLAAPGSRVGAGRARGVAP